MDVGDGALSEMNRTSVLLVVASVLLVAATAPLGAAMHPAPTGTASADSSSAASAATAPAMANESTNNSTNATGMAPGERLAGVFGVQQAELEGTVAQRTFGLRVAQANSADAKAAIVANQSATLEQRLAALEERKQRLTAAYENGSISKGQYRAKMAALTAQTQTLNHLANETEQVARGLPADERREHGVNVSAIQQLQRQAANLTGPEVAAVAHTIAGPDIGTVGNVTRGPPASVPAGNVSAGNASGNTSAQQARQAITQAEAQVTQADTQVERAAARVSSDSGETAAALERARTNLSAAETALADARAALDAGNYEAAVTLAQQAQADAEVATEQARTAVELSGSATVDAGTTTTGNTTRA